MKCQAEVGGGDSPPRRLDLGFFTPQNRQTNHLHQHKMPPAKRRKVAPKVEEVNFDSAARHEFLTGFRKRKQQRTRHAQEVAEKRAREEARLQKKRVRESYDWP